MYLFSITWKSRCASHACAAVCLKTLYLKVYCFCRCDYCTDIILLRTTDCSKSTMIDRVDVTIVTTHVSCHEC